MLTVDSSNREADGIFVDKRLTLVTIHKFDGNKNLNMYVKYTNIRAVTAVFTCCEYVMSPWVTTSMAPSGLSPPCCACCRSLDLISKEILCN